MMETCLNFLEGLSQILCLTLFSLLPKIFYKVIPKMTCDPDGYSPFLVQQLVSAFADPLALLFSSFLSIGEIPSAWKRAIITPIFK